MDLVRRLRFLPPYLCLYQMFETLCCYCGSAPCRRGAGLALNEYEVCYCIPRRLLFFPPTPPPSCFSKMNQFAISLCFRFRFVLRQAHALAFPPSFARVHLRVFSLPRVDSCVKFSGSASGFPPGLASQQLMFLILSPEPPSALSLAPVF